MPLGGYRGGEAVQRCCRAVKGQPARGEEQVVRVCFKQPLGRFGGGDACLTAYVAMISQLVRVQEW